MSYRIKISESKKKIHKVTPTYKYFICYLLTFFIIVFPFITYLHIEELKGKSLEFFANSSGNVIDFFLYSKEIAVIVFAIFVVLFFISEHIFPDVKVKEIPLKNKNAKYLVWIVLLYTVLVVLSCIMSKEKESVIMGISTEYEGVFALLSYMVLLFAGYNYFDKKPFRIILKKGLIILMVCIVIFSLIEYFYKPLFELKFMKYLIAPKKYREIADSMKNVYFKGRVGLSFYNPSYFGSMCALLFPLSLGFAYDEKNRIKKIGFLVLTSGIGFSMMASLSTGAVYATIIVTIMFMISMRKRWKKILLTMGEFLLISVILFSVAGFIHGNNVFMEVLKGTSRVQKTEKLRETFKISEIQLEDGILYVESNELSLSIEALHGSLSTVNDLLILDKRQAKISMSINNNEIHFLEKSYDSVSITVEDGIMRLDCNYDDTIDFYITEKGFRFIGQNQIALDYIPSSRMKGLEQFYSLFTGRGYAWINTLPILKECILYGKGPGSFVFYFTQQDVTGMLNTHRSYKYVADKPHNWYLQIAVNTGILSLIILLMLFGTYVWRGFRKYYKNNYDSIFETSIFFSILSFLLLGIINDSSITVNPIFWFLFGIGYYLLGTSKQNETIE